jgi:hypothetical protein
MNLHFGKKRLATFCKSWIVAVQGLKRGILRDKPGSESISAGMENSVSSDKGNSSDGNESKEEELGPMLF